MFGKGIERLAYDEDESRLIGSGSAVLDQVFFRIKLLIPPRRECLPDDQAQVGDGSPSLVLEKLQSEKGLDVSERIGMLISLLIIGSREEEGEIEELRDSRLEQQLQSGLVDGLFLLERAVSVIRPSESCLVYVRFDKKPCRGDVFREIGEERPCIVRIVELR